MIQRCTNHKNKYYPNYGGRGITVCQEWRDSFENFLKDMGECPSKHQIDRIDNNGGYRKENCRWVTPKTNSRNRRDNRLETHNGKTQCLAAWAEEIGINIKTLGSRLRNGWSIENALKISVAKKEK